MKTSAQVATISTFVFFALNTIALFIHFNGAHLFNEIFLPIGFLVSSFGIYAVRTERVENVNWAAIAFVALSIGGLVRNIIFLYARVEGVKTEIFDYCIQNLKGKFNLTESDCRDISSNETSSFIISQTVLLLFLFFFTYILFSYVNYLKNPPPPMPEQFQMGPYGEQPFNPYYYGGSAQQQPMYNLPPYPVNDSKDGLPPQYMQPIQPPPNAYTAPGKTASLYPPPPPTTATASPSASSSFPPASSSHGQQSQQRQSIQDPGYSS